MRPPLALRLTDQSDADLIAEINQRHEVQALGIGRVNLAALEVTERLFTIVAEGVKVGVVGVVRDSCLSPSDHGMLCALVARAEGRGIGSAACWSVLDAWASGEGAWTRLLAKVDVSNGRSRRLIGGLALRWLASGHGFVFLQQLQMHHEDVYAFTRESAGLAGGE